MHPRRLSSCDQLHNHIETDCRPDRVPHACSSGWHSRAAPVRRSAMRQIADKIRECRYFVQALPHVVPQPRPDPDSQIRNVGQETGRGSVVPNRFSAAVAPAIARCRYPASTQGRVAPVGRLHSATHWVCPDPKASPSAGHDWYAREFAPRTIRHRQETRS